MNNRGVGMKVLVSGGGTGGHIYPALALIRTIKKENPQAEFLYVGTENGLEANIVGKENIAFKSIVITGFKRSISLENFKTIYRFLKGVSDCKKIVKEFKPDVVIGTGGYVCGPVLFAAAKLRVPTIIHEQNSVPGLTNKFLSKYVDKIAICFEQVKEFFPEEKVVYTGNPRATEVVQVENKGSLTQFDLQDGVPTALIVGGSRGARAINETVLQSLPLLAEKQYQILYVTGEVHYDQVLKELQSIGVSSNVKIVPFIHNMQEILPIVDVVVGRAGATSIAEINALGLPSILIPSPYVTNNHQEKNARVLVEHGASILIKESELTSKQLIESLDTVLLNEQKREKMKIASKQLGMPNASQVLFTVMGELIKK